MNGPEIHVGLVDDHQMLRDGLRLVVSEAGTPMHVVMEAGTAREALDLLDQTRVEVLITDIAMHGMDGIQLAREAIARNPRLRVIVLSMHNDAELVERAVSAGVHGYLLKDHAADRLVDAIAAVSRGDTYFEAGIPPEIVTQFRYARADPEKPSVRLTPRQTEVLRLICDGLTERDIAAELGISHHTVHVHKNNIMQTLNLHSKVDLVKYAVRHRLVQT